MSDKKWIEGLVSTIYDKNKGDFTADDWETGAAKNIIAKTVLGLNEYPLSIYKAIFEIKSRYKDISWLSDDSFSSLLIHLRNIVYSKIESHALSACIVVAKTQSAFLKKKLAENFSKSVVVIRDIHKKETGKDNVVSAAHLKTLSKYYTLANPRTSIFVYSDKKKFLGMFDIKKSKTENQMLPYDKMAEFTADCNAFVLLTEENRNCIRMFFCGRHIADFFLNESTGNWILRFTEDIENFVKLLNLNEASRNRLVSDIIYLSYRKIGSILVFTKKKLTRGVHYKDSGVRFSKDVYLGSDHSKNYLIEAATMDGAVLLKLENNSDGGNNARIYEFGAILNNGSGYSKKCKTFKMGARHKSAASFSHKHKNALIVVISENRGISIFSDGEPLMFKDTIISEKQM